MHQAPTYCKAIARYSFCLEHAATLSFIQLAFACPADPRPVIVSLRGSSLMAPYHMLFKHVYLLDTTYHRYNFILFECRPLINVLNSTQRLECNKCLYTDYMANFQSIVYTYTA